MTTALKNQIRTLARDSVRKAIEAEFSGIRASLLPAVSKKEQENIEKLYKKPSRRAVKTLRVTV
ncbi:MAG: hypothetical protein COV91_06115 [Candidatus Taylorbacteria bacterium CG11_big_fil_rev_8_21_14_0_20_46_11]|uniref:Uncharacterized protein n=1 Tax=Candidatus Taylorbacteria bacterium CG11_big_fil_rev_8_21_14_0_20_46_11 TaxID=1975025 RepID=A0A2H0K9Y7_9BACT|nr:MAG: hypothetical protein COV91_06115 [Candidatus Taylorbacteria bacterium CG11_big_fil_rev_8_21_14_0_20_46_11]